MSQKAASTVLKVMLIWLLGLFGILVFRNVLPGIDFINQDIESGFFVGGFLGGMFICLVTILVLVVNREPKEQNNAKKSYAAVGMILAVFGLFMMSLSACYDPIMVKVFGSSIQTENWYTWVKSFLITDVFCLLVVMAVASMSEKTPIEKHKMTVGQFICAIFMNAGIIGIGAIIGAIVEFSIAFNFGIAGGGQTISDMLIESNDFWRILTVGIGAPIVEELIFRKFLIDRVHKYGEGIAIFVSGFLFGLFHGNFSQFFFATGVGLFFAFIYVRTGRVWYSILLHMVVNMSTSVISINLIEMMDLEKMEEYMVMDLASSEATQMALELLPSMLLFLGWVLFLVICTIVGWILWIVKRKKLFLKKSEEYVEKKKFCTAFCNFGMIIFLILCVVRFMSFYI
ncbi:MAG: CPBP family intramembrane metalloprotease [Lachnospiraceae bacterium]|nr:CPBP family intramembrane metalloprotease [Lachnospiraceae bacterium]